MRKDNNLSKFLKLLVIKYKVLIAIFILLPFLSYSQIPKSIADTVKGRDTIPIVNKNSEKNSLEVHRSLYIDDQNSAKQYVIFDLLEEKIQKGNLVLKKGIDYKNFAKELAYILELKKSAIEGVIVNQSEFQSVRNLTLTSVMLHEVFLRTDEQTKLIKRNNKELSNIQKDIDSLITLEHLFVAPKDPSSKNIYFERYNQLTTDVNQIRGRLKSALDSINILEIKSKKLKYELQYDIIGTEKLRKKFQENLLSNRIAIFDSKNNKISFGETYIYSLKKEIILLLFYLFNHINLILLMIISILGISFFLNVLKRKYVKTGLYDDFNYPVQIFRHSIACASLISIVIFQFFFPLPPFAFISNLWLIIGLLLSFILYGTSSKSENWVWFSSFALIIPALFLNNILLHSVTEAWLLLLLTLVTIGTFLYNLRLHKNAIPIGLNWVMKFTIMVEFFALIFLLVGNYNLGKILVTNGIFTIFLAFAFFGTYHKIVDIIKFSNFIKVPEDEEEKRELNFKNYEVHKISFVTYLILVLGWFTLIFRSSYFYQNISSPFQESISETKTIGDLTYSYEKIIFFFLVIFMSAFISKVVSFLTTESEVNARGLKTNKLGSWLLLIRIAIFSVGVIIAFAIAGIPMDKIAIIISALGVGIGFGLQTLINNLVSGLILAFEKPINLDDIIEVGGRTGKMKSIGFRSSVVTTFDGADVIIPNGDLLNQHLTNWTLGSSKLRSEIQIGVAYGTDLKLSKALIQEILEKHNFVLKYPLPMIWITNFNESCIDISIKYWIPHFNHVFDVKSELLISIDEVFRKNNIVIPFPQRDIHLHTDANESAPNEEKE
jgi:potassium-dependent mechanosensitive channel